MKNKTLKILLIGCLLISLTSCKLKKENNNIDEIKNNRETNSLVLYFSATGTTKNIASQIALNSNSDIIEIIPEEAYTSADLDYNSDCRANREQNDPSARPAIKNQIDISKYDTIYLGYPIWWGNNPKIILTLLDTYDFEGKTIIPFCTSGSTDIANSVSNLRAYNPKLNIKDGKRFSANDSEETIQAFIKENLSEVTNQVKAIIDNNEYTIILEDNETAKSFVNLLPAELNMQELNGNEKYIYLDNNLPTNATNPGRIKAGDVMLYGDNCLVIFYQSFDTTYSYTKIGHIDNLPVLNNDKVLVKFTR